MTHAQLELLNLLAPKNQLAGSGMFNTQYRERVGKRYRLGGQSNRFEMMNVETTPSTGEACSLNGNINGMYI